MIGILEKTKKFKQNPENAILREELKAELDNVKFDSIENSSDFLTIAKAYEAQGDIEKAKRFTDSAEKANPKSKDVKKFRRSLPGGR